MKKVIEELEKNKRSAIRRRRVATKLPP